MLTTARDRIAAATGAAFVVLIIIGNTLSIAGTSQGSHPSGAQVLKDAAHQAYRNAISPQRAGSFSTAKTMAA